MTLRDRIRKSRKRIMAVASVKFRKCIILSIRKVIAAGTVTIPTLKKLSRAKHWILNMIY